MTEQLIPINQMQEGQSYKGYDGGLYGNSSNEIPDAYSELGIAVAKQLSKDVNIALGTIGASSISMESLQIFAQLKSIPGIRKDIRMVNACKGGTTFEKMDEKYWQYVRDQFAQNGVKLKDVKIIIMKSDTLSYNGPDSIEYVRNLIDATVERMKKSDLFPNLKIVYFTARNGTHWVAQTEPKHLEPRAYDNGFAVREYIKDHIEASKTALKSGVFVDWIFYAWTDGVNRREDGWLWTQNFTQDSGIHPSPIGREQFAIAIKNAASKNLIAQLWMKKAATTTETAAEPEGLKMGATFNPDEEVGKEDVSDKKEEPGENNSDGNLTVFEKMAALKGNVLWVGDTEDQGVTFQLNHEGSQTYYEFRQKYPFEISEGVYSADEKHATETIKHTVHEGDVNANPDADLKIGEEVELPITPFEKSVIEDAKVSDLPGGETDKHVTDAAELVDNVKEDSNTDSKDSKEDSKTNTKKTDKKDGSGKKGK